MKPQGWERKLEAGLAMLLVTGILLTPASAAQEQQTPAGSYEMPPTTEEISQAVATTCGHLLQWDKDKLGDAAALEWRADYGKCALGAIENEQLLERIVGYCQGREDGADLSKDESTNGHEVASCISTVINQNGLGPQLAAYFEACVVVNEVYPNTCDYDHLIGALDPERSQGQESDTNPCGPIGGVDDVVECVGEALCEDTQHCIDELINVEHRKTDFIANDACAGVKVSTEASGEASGFVFTIGIFTFWKTKASLSVDTNVEWEMGCETPVEITGRAWGGFMRQMRIERGTEQDVLCRYDGFERFDCGDLPGEAWEEDTLAPGEGTYDAEEEDGMLPPRAMTVATKPGGNFINEFQGSLTVSKLFDEVSDVLGGSRDYFVDWTDADDGGLTGLVDPGDLPPLPGVDDLPDPCEPADICNQDPDPPSDPPDEDPPESPGGGDCYGVSCVDFDPGVGRVVDLPSRPGRPGAPDAPELDTIRLGDKLFPSFA